MKLLRAILVSLLALQASAAFTSTNDAKWIGDLDYLVRELPRRHKNAFFQVSRSNWEAAASALRRDIPLLADHEVIVGLTRLTAMIGDAHTTLYGYSYKRLPISIYQFADGWYVTRATSDHRDLLGARLLSIGNHPIEEVAGVVAAVVSYENEWWLREQLPFFLTAPEVLHALKVTGQPGVAHFTFTTAAGELVERELIPTAGSVSWITVDLRPLYMRSPESNYWYEYLPPTRTLYVKYNRCRDNPAQPFTSFWTELKNVIATRDVDRLVLDVRNNGGGNSSVLQPLITGIQTIPELNQPDRFFVVVGRGTFSSAVLNSIELRKQTNATFIGEPTGGKPNMYGEVKTFVLPGSGLTVSYSIKYFLLLPGEDPPAFMPDALIQIASGDYFSGHDPVVGSILPRVGRRRSARP